MESPISPQVIQNVRKALSNIFGWIHIHRLVVIASILGVGIVGGAATLYWYRGSVVGYARKVLSVTAPSSPVVAASPDALFVEQIQELKQHVSTLEKAYTEDAQYRQQLVQDFQSAIHEVAENNDELVKQGQTLSSTIKDIKAQVQGLAIESSSETGISSNSTSPNSVTSSEKTESGKININTATASQLDGLPGIGPSYAEKIISYRSEHSGFKSIQELKNVPGIGDATFEKLKDLITV